MYASKQRVVFWSHCRYPRLRQAVLQYTVPPAAAQREADSAGVVSMYAYPVIATPSPFLQLARRLSIYLITTTILSPRFP